MHYVTLFLLFVLSFSCMSFSSASVDEPLEVSRECSTVVTKDLHNHDKEIYKKYVTVNAADNSFFIDSIKVKEDLGDDYSQQKIDLIVNNMSLLNNLSKDLDCTVSSDGSLHVDAIDDSFVQQFSAYNWEFSWWKTTFILDNEASIAMGLLSVIWNVLQVHGSYKTWFSQTNSKMASLLVTAIKTLPASAVSQFACDQIELYAGTIINIVMGIQAFCLTVGTIAEATPGIGIAVILLKNLFSWIISCYMPSIYRAPEMIAYGFRGSSYKGEFGWFASNYIRL